MADENKMKHKLKEGISLQTTKKWFQPAFGYKQHPKAGQNTQQVRKLILENSFSLLCKIISTPFSNLLSPQHEKL